MSIQGFAPVANRNARVLVLGSMPGRASLNAVEYYAHPQNAFWPIMGALVGAAPALPYPKRIAALKAARIALWDVLASCERQGSLDTAICHDSVEVNDFTRFFANHSQIVAVFFNGQMAETCFRRYVAPALGDVRCQFSRLPSTSPAHASLTRAAKLELWRQAFNAHGIIENPQKEHP